MTEVSTRVPPGFRRAERNIEPRTLLQAKDPNRAAGHIPWGRPGGRAEMDKQVPPVDWGHRAWGARGYSAVLGPILDLACAGVKAV